MTVGMTLDMMLATKRLRKQSKDGDKISKEELDRVVSF